MHLFTFILLYSIHIFSSFLIYGEEGTANSYPTFTSDKTANHYESNIPPSLELLLPELPKDYEYETSKEPNDTELSLSSEPPEIPQRTDSIDAVPPELEPTEKIKHYKQ